MPVGIVLLVINVGFTDIFKDWSVFKIKNSQNVHKKVSTLLLTVLTAGVITYIEQIKQIHFKEVCIMMLANRNYNLFNEMFHDPFFTDAFDVSMRSPMMKTDVKEQDGNYLLDIELPGFSKEDVKAELKDGYLTISANKEESKDEKDEAGNYIRKERYTGTCNRSFYVGEGVKEEDIKAKFQDGILQLVIPKDREEIKEQPRLITIE